MNQVELGHSAWRLLVNEMDLRGSCEPVAGEDTELSCESGEKRGAVVGIGGELVEVGRDFSFLRASLVEVRLDLMLLRFEPR